MQDLRLELQFYDPEGELKDFTLTWKCLDRPYVLIWLRTLVHALKNNHAPFSRFSGFPHKKSFSDLALELNEAIDLINEEGLYKIPEKASEKFDQEFANRIHHHFEVLSGDLKNPSDLYQKSSPSAREAIGRLNYCIHDMEALKRAEVVPESNRYLAFELWQPRQFWLQEEELRHFTLDLNFGDLCLHYGLIGKSWFEVYLDEDEEIFEEGIRPLDVLGPEFDIHFLPQKHDPKMVEKFYSWLSEQGQDPSDPRLALGFLPLAHLLEEKESPQQVIEEVGKRSLKSIRIWNQEDPKLGEWLSVDLTKAPTLNQGFWKLHQLRSLEGGAPFTLELEKFPIQTFRVQAKSSGARMDSFVGDGPQGDHTIGLYLAKESEPITVAGELLGGAEVQILPGQSCHFLGNGQGHYKLLKL